MAKPNKEQENAINILLQWYKDKSPSAIAAVLSGYAGTGKTFTTNYFAKAVGIPTSRILVAAPTNKAVAVISEMTNLKGKTIHSMLGLQPNMDLSTFTPTTMKFTRQGEGDMNYKLIIIDEASMINISLYEEILKRADNENVKILFLGDSLQLLPVKETRVSKVFTDPLYKAKLTEIIRQGDNNPNTDLIRVAIKDILNKTDKLDAYIQAHQQNIPPKNIKKTKGFVYVPTSGHSLVHFFEEDAQNLYLGYSKYMAYTNQNINTSVRNIRRGIFKLDDYLTAGEQLMGYRAVTIGKGKQANIILTNSEEYEVISTDRITIREGIQGYMVTLRDYYGENDIYVNIVDGTDEESFERYSEIVRELYQNAKTVGRAAWVKYYDFINNILSFENVTMFIAGSDKVIKTKDLFYSSGITVHKSQGSTYENSFINLTNINRCYSDDDRRRLKYVALSRASNCNVII